MKLKQLYYAHVFLLSALASVIACSPTKFSQAVGENVGCTPVELCVVTPDGLQEWTQPHKVGTGKVDILFVNDNSASMSVIQTRMAEAFGGFIERLDAREIDYRIAMTTTDATKLSSPLITFGNTSTFLTGTDINRVALFNGAIVRQETTACENVIKSYYNTFGSNFQSQASYATAYNNSCASSDERGILMANSILSNNTGSFVRSDAHLNIIVISNEDVRSGNTASFTTEDRASNLASTVNSKFSGKYWEFNSIITKDAVCAFLQKQQFKTAQGQEIKDQAGNYVIGANPGIEYAALSASASQDIDGNAQPRGQIIDICQTNYSTHFNNMAAKVADSARRFDLKCSPSVAPEISVINNPAATVPYTWNGNHIVFKRGSEGINVMIKYKCPKTGGVQ